MELLSDVLIVVWLECEGPTTIHVPIVVLSCLQQKGREKLLTPATVFLTTLRNADIYIFHKCFREFVTYILADVLDH